MPLRFPPHAARPLCRALFVVLTALSGPVSASSPLLPPDLPAYARSHDLRLPAWGPYTNAYLGLSHVTDAATGVRFDITVFGGPHTTTTPSVPNASLNTGFYAWDAAPDLSYYSFRQMIEGRQLHAEIAYAALDERTRIVRAELVNASDRHRTLVLNLLASLQLPNRAPNAVLTPRRILKAVVPAGGRWVGALPYDDLSTAQATPQDRLVYDGRLLGEQRDDGMVDGRALRLQADDRVSYRLAGARRGETLVVRYRPLKGAGRLQLQGLSAATLDWPAEPGYRTAIITLDADAAPGGDELALLHAGGDAVEIDGFAVVAAAGASEVRFQPEESDMQPQRLAGPVADSMLLKYRHTDAYYGIRWYRDRTFVREYRHGVLDGFFPRNSMRKTATVLDGDRRGHYTAVQFRGKALPPGGRETIWAVVSVGTRAEVEAALAIDQPRAQAAHAAAHARAAPPPRLPQGRGYDLAFQLIRANLLLNVVYPVYTQNQYIRHFAPGKWWDSLYTWDSGFIGIGMAAVAPRLSADVLNAYTTRPGAQSAFIHHGTPLPVQHHQFLELWNRTQDRDWLEHAYPRLRQYYEFLLGRMPGSTTASLRSGLLKTWDYFYNSGGWDDYPAQLQVHGQRLTATTAPMVTASHAIRAAKILRMAALETGRQEDVKRFDADIERLSQAIQQHAWDADSGYFGYVVHDAEGRAQGLLRTPDGEQANKGLDGVQPLVAGITSPEQTRRLIEHLTDPRRLWSPIGITAVDQSAGYYRADGYWNGTVWFPHQWFVWKALLDQGRDDLAWRIARTALGLYEREAQASWVSAEHFEIATGQGVGWHQFSGLSAPIASWFAHYFQLGNLTGGYDVWVRSRQFSDDHRRLQAELVLHSPRSAGSLSVLAVMAPGDYAATWNGRAVPVRSVMPGALAIQLPAGSGTGRLVVMPRGGR